MGFAAAVSRFDARAAVPVSNRLRREIIGEWYQPPIEYIGRLGATKEER
jgi:hypothetical protein